MDRMQEGMEALAERMDALEDMAQKFKSRTLPDMRKEVRAALGPSAKAAAKMAQNHISVQSLYNTMEILRHQIKNLE